MNSITRFIKLLLALLVVLSITTTAQARFLSPDTWDPMLQGVDINRYAYALDDPVNGSDPNGHGLKGKAAKEALKAAAEALSKQTVKSLIEQARREAVKQAWRDERALILKTGRGTYNWSKKEIDELLKSGKVKGYDGHHINSVNDAAGLAGNPDNIKFMKDVDHRKFHAENGGTQVPTKGPLQNRKSAYEQMQGEVRALFDAKQQELDDAAFRESLPPAARIGFDALDIMDHIDPTDPGTWIGGAY